MAFQKLQEKRKRMTRSDSVIKSSSIMKPKVEARRKYLMVANIDTGTR